MFSVQCLLLGLHGYLIHFAPLAFILNCQNCPRKMPSLLIVRSRLTHFTATVDILLTSISLQRDSTSCALYILDIKFHKKLIKQATDVLDLIKMVATWTASITAAAGTRLTQSLFVKLFRFHKSFSNEKHSDLNCHTCVYCRLFLTAAPRRAGNSISDSLSGPLR